MVQHRFENFAIGIDDVQNFLGVWLEGACVDNRIYHILIIFQILHEVVPVVAHVDQAGLVDFRYEELVLGVFSCGVGDVAEVFVTDEGVEENVVEFHEQCQFVLLTLRKIGNSHQLVLHSDILEYTVSSVSILTNHLILLAPATPLEASFSRLINLIRVTLVVTSSLSSGFG